MSQTSDTSVATVLPVPVDPTRLTGAQWKSGIAAWLGWLFDGLDMHLYTIVAAQFVAELVLADATSAVVKEKSSYIQAAFLIGWALGGGFFGRIGDRLGRSRALSLTIITYAAFTGLSALSQTWWQLMIFRFLAALGIGGEWAVGSSLLSETWPKAWRPWIAAVLQTAVNLGVMLAYAATYAFAGVSSQRYVFLVGILPALIVFWIRRAVPEPAEWHAAMSASKPPPMSDLFRGRARRITLLTIVVCACSLTAWWAFMFWTPQLMRQLPEISGWTPADKNRLASTTLGVLIGCSIPGNFFAGWVAKVLGFRRGIALMCLGFFLSVYFCWSTPRSHTSLLWVYIPLVGFFSGIFGLFTMYLPPLFPTLLRTTGAGFSYNIGRIAAAAGTIVFGKMAAQNTLGDLRVPLLYGAFLFLPAMGAALLLPDLKDADETAAPVH